MRNPAADSSGVPIKGFGKKRGRKEDLRERPRLTASVTFLFIDYGIDLNAP